VGTSSKGEEGGSIGGVGMRPVDVGRPRGAVEGKGCCGASSSETVNPIDAYDNVGGAGSNPFGGGALNSLGAIPLVGGCSKPCALNGY
jgi:hypothetical protein